MSIKHPISPQGAQDFIDHYYFDRGMMKWHGFMLSDHVASIKQAKSHRLKQGRHQQNHSMLMQIIHTAALSHRQVAIQIADKQQHFDIYGVILGFRNQRLFVNTTEVIVQLGLKQVENIQLKN